MLRSPWHYFSGWWLQCSDGGAKAGHQHIGSFAGRSMILTIASFSLQDPLGVFMFANRLSHLAVLLLVCNSTWYPTLPYVMYLAYGSNVFFVLFFHKKVVCSNSTSVFLFNGKQLLICLYLCGLQWHACASSFVILCLSSSPLHPVSPPLEASAIHPRPLFLHTTSLRWF